MGGMEETAGMQDSGGWQQLCLALLLQRAHSLPKPTPGPPMKASLASGAMPMNPPEVSLARVCPYGMPTRVPATWVPCPLLSSVSPYARYSLQDGARRPGGRTGKAQRRRRAGSGACN